MRLEDPHPRTVEGLHAEGVGCLGREVIRDRSVEGRQACVDALGESPGALDDGRALRRSRAGLELEVALAVEDRVEEGLLLRCPLETLTGRRPLARGVAEE